MLKQLIRWLLGERPEPAAKSRSKFPPPKRRYRSYSYRNGVIKVRWSNPEASVNYAVSPKQEDSFLDSAELYIIMRMLSNHDRGFRATFNGVEFTIAPEDRQENLPHILTAKTLAVLPFNR